MKRLASPLDSLGRLLDGSRRLVVLTGAGCSTDSGSAGTVQRGRAVAAGSYFVSVRVGDRRIVSRVTVER